MLIDLSSRTREANIARNTTTKQKMFFFGIAQVTSAWSIVGLLFLLHLSNDKNQVSAQTFGPGALNNLIFYVVDNDVSPTTFMCGSISSRCIFQRGDYSSEPEIRGGNIADQLEGAVWTAVDPTSDQLILDDCVAAEGTCITACFLDCTCTTAARRRSASARRLPLRRVRFPPLASTGVGP